MTSGTATLKDATSEAIRDWVTNVESTHYILGSAAGPHPYPMMVGAPLLCCARELGRAGEGHVGSGGTRGRVLRCRAAVEDTAWQAPLWPFH